MRERRKFKRERRFLRGCIYFNNSRDAVDCLIQDISYEGARIVLSDSADVPHEVQLYIPGVSFSRMCGGTTLTNWGSPSPKLLPDADSFAIATPAAQFATTSYHRRGFRSLWRIIASGLRAND